jgi:hypothetical protein
MADYSSSLHPLLDRADDIYLFGYGPPLQEPRKLAR